MNKPTCKTCGAEHYNFDKCEPRPAAPKIKWLDEIQEWEDNSSFRFSPMRNEWKEEGIE